MRTLLTILTLIGLQFTTGCKVTNNYYSIYPTKVERAETYEYPSIDPGFYHPVNKLPSFDDQTIDLRGWYPEINSLD